MQPANDFMPFVEKKTWFYDTCRIVEELALKAKRGQFGMCFVGAIFLEYVIYLVGYLVDTV